MPIADRSVELMVEAGALCGESPLWNGRRLLWNDMNASMVFEFDPVTGSNRVIGEGLPVAGMALNENGLLVLAGSGLHLWREPGEYQTIVSEYGGKALNFNDILADSAGRIYAATYHWGDAGVEEPGTLYRIDPGGEITSLDTGFLLANGLGLSPDQGTLYLADSIARRIYAYPVEPATGVLGSRTTFVEVPVTEGMPDGLTVDAEGFVWSAQWHGGRVVRYAPDGTIDGAIPLPVSQVASIGFGGPSLEDLYITTAAELWVTEVMPPGFDAGRPLGGGLYRVRPGVTGRPEHRARFGWRDDRAGSL